MNHKNYKNTMATDGYTILDGKNEIKLKNDLEQALKKIEYLDKCNLTLYEEKMKHKNLIDELIMRLTAIEEKLYE